MKKKILINASILSGKQIGVEVYSNEVLKRLLPLLIQNGYQVEVYAYNYDSLIDTNSVFKKISLSPFFDRLLSKRISIHRIIWNLIKLPSISKFYDVTYSPCTYGGIGVRNQIITVHDLISLSFPSNDFFQFSYFKFLVPLILEKSKIIAISNFTKNSILSSYNIKENQIVTIYNGSDHLSFDVNENNFDDRQDEIKSPFFLSVGLSLPHKNVERLLGAIEKNSNNDYSFVIVGRKTKYFQKMKDYALKRNLQNVIFLDNVDDKFLKSLYSKCVANIYMSLHEGFGFPPLEAACYGKISIVSKGTALSEIYEGHAIFADPYNVDSIKNKIEDVIVNFENSDLPNYELKDLLLKFRWDNTSNRIFDLISQQ
jgi:glycosyltransferase involved in cell wall biosynthesis